MYMSTHFLWIGGWICWLCLAWRSLYVVRWLLSQSCNIKSMLNETIQFIFKDSLRALYYFWIMFFHFCFLTNKTWYLWTKIATILWILDHWVVYRCMGLNRGWEEAASMFSRAAVELKTSNPALLETAGKSWDKVWFHYHVSFPPLVLIYYGCFILCTWIKTRFCFIRNLIILTPQSK